MPDARTFIDEDFVVVKTDSGTKFTLWFGDEIVVLGKQGGRTRVRVLGHGSGPFEGTVKGTPKTRPTGVLSVSMVDVQQGDGLILETPDGKIVFIDGGDNKLFARHAAARYRHRQSTNDTPLEIDAIVVTHGDADHFKRCPPQDGNRQEDRGPSAIVHPPQADLPQRPRQSAWQAARCGDVR
ncbi:MAG: hypothetical protein OSB03_14560 [Vicinamibacterales bacterium]|jgi:hypothetical protein|nr:hypothetical protein [Vicinamibacterales bacterium]